jgi:hypothetical protein
LPRAATPPRTATFDKTAAQALATIIQALRPADPFQQRVALACHLHHIRALQENAWLLASEVALKISHHMFGYASARRSWSNE